MSKNCPIMTRMKENYESRSRTYLTRRIPVIIRLDGKAFHTYTKGLNKPFDEGLIEDMQLTTKYLCENIQGVKCGYTQSDEISLLLTDYDNVNTEAWFDNNVQKMVSVSASLATGIFNQYRTRRHLLNSQEMFYNLFDEDYKIATNDIEKVGERKHKLKIMQSIQKEFNSVKLANFDSRVFSIPQSEVNNYFIARQRDAVKNSISMLAQSLYSHSELHGIDSNGMQELCFQKGHNWNDLDYSKKRGSFIIKQTYINGKTEFDGTLGLDPEIGDLWYQPNNQSIFYPDERGRLLEWNERADNGYLDWCDVKIESIRTKWDVIETPEFSKSDIINNLIN